MKNSLMSQGIQMDGGGRFHQSDRNKSDDKRGKWENSNKPENKKKREREFLKKKGDDLQVSNFDYGLFGALCWLLLTRKILSLHF